MNKGYNLEHYDKTLQALPFISNWKWPYTAAQICRSFFNFFSQPSFNNTFSDDESRKRSFALNLRTRTTMRKDLLIFAFVMKRQSSCMVMKTFDNPVA